MLIPQQNQWSLPGFLRSRDRREHRLFRCIERGYQEWVGLSRTSNGNSICIDGPLSAQTDPLPHLIRPNPEPQRHMRPEGMDQRHICRVAPLGHADLPDTGLDVPRVEACARCRRCGGQAGAGSAGMPSHGRNGGLPAEGPGADAFLFRAEDSVQDHGPACLTAGHHSDAMQFGYPSEVFMPRQEPSHDTSRRYFICDPQWAT